MELNLKGKVVVVTGGGSNIGRSISLAFSAEGCNTVIADLDENQGQKVVQEIVSTGGKATYVKMDVTNFPMVEQAVAKIIESFGQIDVLVNGVGWVIDRLFIETPRAEWEKQVDLNYWSYVNCTKAVVDHMVKRKSGKIVNISSDAGRIGEYRESVYSGCKAGVIGLTKSLAKELGPSGININVVCPGVIIPEENEAGKFSMWKTELATTLGRPEVREKMVKAYPLRRLGKASEVANAVVFLSSSAADYITGQTLSVSGGYAM